jgi:glutaminyl-tRNA synthetase
MAEPQSPDNFIKDIVVADLREGRHRTVVTRFPPEPNGYLHIGHAKAICLDFGLAQELGGRCHLRMDDSNPETEDMEYVEAIQRDIHWLGFDWGEHLYFAADYFERIYEQAEHLVKSGKAYVDSLSEDDMRAYRGTITEPGKPSPYRDRPVGENLDLLRRMRAGEFADGAHVLRAKIDLASPNMKMRDPALYRIKHEPHYRTGTTWCIYPLYDFVHPLSDAFEGITHSICTLEFENNRELYDWVIDNCKVDARPRQYEFARLNLSYTLMSKRKLLKLVEDGRVSGWDDPRMPTIAGIRRRGYTPEAIRKLCEMVGVAKNNSTVDLGKLEFCVRDDLNRRAPRAMCVLDPLEVELTDLDGGEELEAPCFPPDVGGPGTRKIPLSSKIFIERDDFAEDPPPGYHRLAPGREVRLRYAGIVRCDEVVRDAAGAVKRLRCGYERADRAVKGTIHWVSAAHAVPVTVRLYDRLFQAERPEELEDLNPNSLVIRERCMLEPAAAAAAPGSHFQFERQGYFFADPIDSKPGAPVFNRTVTLRDTWAKIQSRSEATPSRPSAPRQDRPSGPKGPTPSVDPLAKVLGKSPLLADAVAGALERRGDLHTPLGNVVVNVVAAVVNERGDYRPAVDLLIELAEMLHDKSLTVTQAREIAAEIGDGDESARKRAKKKGWLGEQVRAGALTPVVESVLAAHPAEVARYRSGKIELINLFLGKVMKETRGKADAGEVRVEIERQLRTEV